jgi:hypothetical protein
VTGAPLCYVYAIVDAPPRHLEVCPGVDGTAVTTVERGELAAVVSLVDRDRFDAESLRANLEDLDWLERTARAHHQVIDTIARQTPVAPLRMATILWDERGVAELLEANRPEFTEVLERVRGREEWGVKAYAMPVGPRDAPPGPAESAGGPGAAYLMRKRGQRDRARQAVQTGADLARRLHDVLTGHSVAARVYPPQDPRLSGRTEPMALNAAYLVAAADAESLRAAAARFDSPDLRVELTGPWAPYSFAEVSQP